MVAETSIEAKRLRKHEGDGMSLPEDIIFDVLVRLPVKVLCRFRCVSKAWHALISKPSFAACQRSHAGPLIVGVFGSSPHYELRVLDMHGDVLRVIKDVETPFVAPTRLDLICVNRRCHGAMIVDPAACRVFTIGNHMHDEEIRWDNYSFGRSATTGTYKVLRLCETYTTVCEVATITGAGGEPTWRQRPTPNLFNGFSYVQKATVKGVIYFMPANIYGRAPGWNRVAPFDLESEVWRDAINGPPLEEQVDWWIALMEFKETLCMVHNIQFVNGHGLYSDIWCLIDHNKGVWVKTHTIQLPTGCHYTEAWDVLDDGRILLLNRICSRIVLQFFHPRTKAFTHIMEMPEEYRGTMTLYTGSLLSS